MRMRQKRVWLLAGVPGSGKSTWVRKMVAERGGIHCSRDEIRFSLLKDGEDYFAHEDDVVRLWTEKVHQAILSPDVDDVYIDATHLTEKSRAKVINSLPASDYTITTVFFDIPLDICLERNASRTGRAHVPEETIRNMHRAYNNFTIYGDYTVHIRQEENK